MRIITALKEQPVPAILGAIAIFLLVPIVQFINTPLAFQIWYLTLLERPLNSILYIIFSILFGMFISLCMYSTTKCVDCKKSDVSTGFGGAMLGFLLGICPACFSLITAFLPLAGSILLTAYAPAFTFLAILMILFSIYRLGGFKKM